VTHYSCHELAVTPSLFLELTLVEAAVASVALATISLFSLTFLDSSAFWEATVLAASPLAASVPALLSHLAPLSFSSGSGAAFSAAERTLRAAP